MIKTGSQHLDALKDGRQIFKARNRQGLRFGGYQTKFSHLLSLACAAAIAGMLASTANRPVTK